MKWELGVYEKVHENDYYDVVTFHAMKLVLDFHGGGGGGGNIQCTRQQCPDHVIECSSILGFYFCYGSCTVATCAKLFQLYHYFLECASF